MLTTDQVGVSALGAQMRTIRAVAIQPAKVIVVAGHASSMGVTVQVSQGRMSRRDSVDEVNVVRVGVVRWPRSVGET